MTETNSEQLANAIQLYFFIVDALEEGVKIEQDIINRASKSLPKIQYLLKEIDKDYYNYIKYLEKDEQRQNN